MLNLITIAGKTTEMRPQDYSFLWYSIAFVALAVILIATFIILGIIENGKNDKKRKVKKRKLISENLAIELWKKRKLNWIIGGAVIGIIMGLVTKSVFWAVASFVFCTFLVPAIIFILIIILSAFTE